MRTIFLALLLCAVLSLLAPPLQRRLRGLLRDRSPLVWLAPPALTAIFAAASVLAGAFSVPLTAAVLLYTALPVVTAWIGQDLLTVLLLWLPLEFAAGAALVPVPARGFLHSVAYGVAILLGLVLSSSDSAPFRA